METIKDLLQSKKEKKKKNDVFTLVDYYYQLKGLDTKPKSFWIANKDNPEFSYLRHSRDAKLLLKEIGDLYNSIKVLYNESVRAKKHNYDWRITTALQRYRTTKKPNGKHQD